MQAFSPREIVSELDRYIIGQDDAKKSVAIALRNRWRRQQLPEDMREEVLPKNILMIGPTGIGKTEISSFSKSELKIAAAASAHGSSAKLAFGLKAIIRLNNNNSLRTFFISFCVRRKV